MAGQVYLVDDEDAIRRSAGLMLRLAGWQVTPFETGASFMGSLAGLPAGCVLLDIRMPGIDGLEVQREMNRRGIEFPIIMMTGHGDIALAVSALRAGALDFVEKPCERTRLLKALDRAELKLHDPGGFESLRLDASSIVARLSDEERLVLSLLAQGIPNRTIATTLDMPVARVELHRAAVIEKTDSSSLADAIRLALWAEIKQD